MVRKIDTFTTACTILARQFPHVALEGRVFHSIRAQIEAGFTDPDEIVRTAIYTTGN